MGINVEALKNYMRSQGASFEDVRELPQYGELVKEVLELKDKLNRSYEANTRLAKEYEDDTDKYRERITELEDQKDKYFNWYVESAALKEGLQDTVDKLRLELDQQKESYELAKELEKFKQHHIDKCNELSGLANKQASKFQSERDVFKNKYELLKDKLDNIIMNYSKSVGGTDWKTEYDLLKEKYDKLRNELKEVISIDFSDNYNKVENRIMTPSEYLKEYGKLSSQIRGITLDAEFDKNNSVQGFRLDTESFDYLHKLAYYLDEQIDLLMKENTLRGNKIERLKKEREEAVKAYDGMKSRAKGLEAQLEKWKDVQAKTVVDKSELMNENEKLQFKIDDMQHAIDYLNAEVTSLKEYETSIDEEYDDLEEEYAHAADVSKVLLWLLQNDINPYHGNEDGDNDE